VVPEPTMPAGPSSGSRRLIVAAPDSFKGTCASTELAEALSRGAGHAGWDCDPCPLSDGGEGFCEVLAAYTPRGRGSWMTARVTGPTGARVGARWWFAPPEAVLESAAASGLVLAGGTSGNDPLAATSRGTGELIVAALRAGADRLLVGVGGSASTDGGIGAVEAIEAAGGFGGAEVLVACDVETSFVEAAAEFGPQKGASPAQVAELSERLLAVAWRYRQRIGIDVSSMARAGAAGGLAGGLAALGAKLVGGFELVAGTVNLDRRIGDARLVVTGEGCLDSSSWAGKVVGGVVSLAASAKLPVLVVAGVLGPGGLPVPGGLRSADQERVSGAGEQEKPDARGDESLIEVVSLAERFGLARSTAEPAACAEEVLSEYLGAVKSLGL
jgi:glycerate 2-kinase